MTFLQIHTLTSYPAALLNRDDVGFAKRVPFGGTTRLRVSSQCLKRHWRTFEGEGAIAAIELGGGLVPMSVRSRRSFEEHVYKPLVAEGIDSAIATAATERVMAAVLGESAKAKKEKAEGKKGKKKGEAESAPVEREPIQTGQVTVLGKPELDFLLGEARAIAKAATSEADVEKVAKEHLTKERLKNLQVLKQGAGLDAALFGRMVTSDYLSRTDAAIHVAHAFSVHGEASESDYFSAIDDLDVRDDALGSGHIGNTELTSGLYYGYVVVDVPLLVANLEGGDRKEWRTKDRALAAEVVRRLAQLIATVSPGAKLGSTAPYAYAHFVMAEWGTAQPRTLANAFESPVVSRAGMLGGAYDKLAGYVKDVDSAYGKRTERRMLAVQAADSLVELGAEKGSLDQLAAFCAQKVGA
ncbi:MAG: type I-E CRISPR-associated protein Cas7/Cse4/CasC [Sandaracinaceae bacterium]|nr:type I-E CRISPR-associated protein Cas7/Cse4/CasC [Sandaracinaceae bacterium]